MGWLFGDSSSFDKAKSNRCFYSELVGKCGSCIHLKSGDSVSVFFGGYKYKCIARGSYYPWDDRTCSKLIELDPEKVDCVKRYKDFTGRTFYYISSMIGLILGKDLNEKPFANIKLLKDNLENDESKQEEIKLYDTYGMFVSTELFFDPNRVVISESLMPILNKVSDLVDVNNYEEAFNTYREMVMMLYTRYTHSSVDACEFDYQNAALNLEKEEKSKMMIKK